MSAISKTVRVKYLEYLAETGMTPYAFSKKSGVPQSTLWSIEHKEDYDVRESNIRKIAKGMGVPVSELFHDDTTEIYVNKNNEVKLVKNYKKLSDRRKGRLEGYMDALLEEDD